MAKIFGAVNAAGVRVEELAGQATILPGALGFVGYAMATERGPTDALITAPTLTSYRQQCGGIIDGSLGPDAAKDFFQNANGAGGMFVCRVTDGNELQSTINLYTRSTTRILLGTLQAKNGGRWGGKRAYVCGEIDTPATDTTETTFQLPAAIATDFTTDQLLGGALSFVEVPNTTYLIIGNTAAGLVTVAADSTILTDVTTTPTSSAFHIEIENGGKQLAVLIQDGEDDPAEEFSISVYLDGSRVLHHGNLDTDPDSARYWVDLINENTSNYYVTATDSFTGTHTALTRPANSYLSSASLLNQTITLTVSEFLITSPGGGDPTFALGTLTGDEKDQVITVTMADATTASAVVSDIYGDLLLSGSFTLGVEFVSECKFAPAFTVTAGASPLVITDTLGFTYKGLVPSELIDGRIYPDKVNDSSVFYRIVANTGNTVTVPAGTDLSGNTPPESVLLEWPEQFSGGRDGLADVVDANYTACWDTIDSLFNRTRGLNVGLVKMATPGITATAVQKAGIAYAGAKNHQYREEFASSILTATAAINQWNNVTGRSDYKVGAFPSYGSVQDPNPAAAREGKLKLVSMTGAIHGREARIAVDNLGYHKAQAGLSATLPQILSVPTGDTPLDEEALNPSGIQVIKQRLGNFIIWGDRTGHIDSSWRFKHKRELVTYYEQVLLESFEFIIFEVNDSASDTRVRIAVQSFFGPEFAKGAIRGSSLGDAAVIKVDAENNNDATRADGNKFLDVALRLADTTERLIVRVSQQGVFEL